MVIREEMGMKPILLNFGLALAISFAGFLYSRLRTSKTKPSTDSHTGSPSDHGNEVNLGGGTGEALNTCNTVSEGNFLYAQEETCIDRAISDNFPTGLSPSSKQNEEKDEFLLPEFNDIVKEVDLGATIVGNFFKKDLEAPRLKVGSSISCADPEKDDHEQEIRQLRNMIRMLQDREQSLEVQLLEYYGLREEETAVMELQNRLKISNMEAKMFNLKVKTLQSENLRLEKEVADHAKVLAELEAAEAKVKLLKRKIRYEAERNREKIITLQQRVSKLQDQECKDVASDQDIQIKLQKLKGLESEAEELRKSNLKLQIENSDLARRLDSTQMLANAVLGDTDVADAMKQENERLRQDNEALMKKIEQLQCDRCSDLEELVYMRWINACLRYELRNYQPPLGKTVAKDLSKSLSPTSEKKAKQLILEYANTDEQGSIVDFDLDQWSSSQASFLTDSGDCDVFSSVDNSSAARTNATSQTKIFSKLRRLILGKDSHYHHSEVSLHEKSGYQQDGNSPGLSTSPRTSTFTSRTSFDFSRLTSMKEGDTTDSLAIEKSNLEKYAEALKDSSASAKHQRRRRSASYS